jgi:hypothetical protein
MRQGPSSLRALPPPWPPLRLAGTREGAAAQFGARRRGRSRGLLGRWTNSSNIQNPRKKSTTAPIAVAFAVAVCALLCPIVALRVRALRRDQSIEGSTWLRVFSWGRKRGREHRTPRSRSRRHTPTGRQQDIHRHFRRPNWDESATWNAGRSSCVICGLEALLFCDLHIHPQTRTQRYKNPYDIKASAAG